IAIGLRDRNKQQLTRGLFGGVLAGLLGGTLTVLFTALISNLYWARGFGFLSMSTVFSIVLFYFSKYQRKEWLKILSGPLEGMDFELSNEIHFLGTQNSDDINLKDYEDINPTHAKMIRYAYGYSLIDNDPFGRTYVNFRSVNEQPLKNGDILKIGSATFQYCRLD
ncbi:MAG: hypothetical protein COB67_12190, partial [SAR324 cluster bacterium]